MNENFVRKYFYIPNKAFLNTLKNIIYLIGHILDFIFRIFLYTLVGHVIWHHLLMFLWTLMKNALGLKNLLTGLILLFAGITSFIIIPSIFLFVIIFKEEGFLIKLRLLLLTVASYALISYFKIF